MSRTIETIDSHTEGNPTRRVFVASVLIAIVSIVLASPALADSKPQMAFSFAGFFNNETKEFNPRSIGYGAMLSQEEVYEKLKGEFEPDFDIAQMDRVEQTFSGMERKDVEVFLVQILGWLKHTNNSLLESAKSCPDCKDDKFIAFENWGEQDRIFVIFGLETRTQRGGLRSGLTVVGFDGGGKYLGIQTTPYDFRWYNADKMYEDCMKLIGAF